MAWLNTVLFLLWNIVGNPKDVVEKLAPAAAAAAISDAKTISAISLFVTTLLLSH